MESATKALNPAVTTGHENAAQVLIAARPDSNVSGKPLISLLAAFPCKQPDDSHSSNSERRGGPQ